MKNKFLVCIFVLMITIPNITFFISGEANNLENRSLSMRPQLNLCSIQSYPQEFDNYYNDNLPFKDFFVKAYSNFKFHLLNMSPYKYVIKGNEGWLFYDSVFREDGDTISDYTGTNQFTPEEKEEIKTKLLEMEKICKEASSEFLIVILPNKETIYGEKFLPEKYSIIDQESRTDELVQYLNKETNLQIVYPKNQLLDERDDFQLYFKLDTHWNNAGAYIGFRQIQQAYSQEKLPFLKSTVNGFVNINDGDLSRMIQIRGLNDIDYDTPYKNDVEVEQFDESLYNTMPVLRCISTADTKAKAVIFRDSYCTALIPFISKDFHESLFVSSLGFDSTVVKKEKPNLVIYEMVERQVKNILYAQHNFN